MLQKKQARNTLNLVNFSNTKKSKNDNVLIPNKNATLCFSCVLGKYRLSGELLVE